MENDRDTLQIEVTTIGDRANTAVDDPGGSVFHPIDSDSRYKEWGVSLWLRLVSPRRRTC